MASNAAAGPSGSPQNENGTLPLANGDEKNSVVIKVGMVGDSQIGKTSLMVKYVEGSFDEDYIQTLGVNFMEKTISVRRTTITFSIWDLGGQREFVNMLPLVCNDAVAILSGTGKQEGSTRQVVSATLPELPLIYSPQSRNLHQLIMLEYVTILVSPPSIHTTQTAIPFLVGTKYDSFSTFPRDEQEEITKQAKRFAKAMHASLIFSSTSASINVQKIFKIVLAKAFDLKCVIPEIEGVGEPILLYVDV
ncbi:Septum-promoting GTP-binding protein 1 [Ceratobasidium sp. AG-Ba]|nr:Septum-promoting GTP-binding protein 1 [Ceratobasidium sp. AG-Ba]